ncbi:MAG: SRPBCC family protein [Bacteroidales bacterium]|nr:SRPBCC family protein [Bacteroidales bacterium]HNW73927.1 SRPBCC family protein [Bacteroidales bacterium]
MKTMLKILYWILGILAVLVIISYLLPKSYKVERVRYVNSTPAILYQLTSNFYRWYLWVPWTKQADSTAVFVLKGTGGLVGSSWRWSGKKFGQGEMILTETIENELVEYDLAFNNGAHKSKGRISIERTGDSCKVVWTDQGDLGYNPVSRYMGLLMDRMMGLDFEKGLLKLKYVAEARSKWPKIEEFRMTPQVILVVTDSAGPDTYPEIMSKAYNEIYSYINTHQIQVSGAPLAIFLKWDSVSQQSTMNIGVPVENVSKGSGRVKVLNIPEQDVVAAQYFGSYSKTGIVYNILDQYIKEIGRIPVETPWEIYVTDPHQEKDTMKWQTTILFPLK